MIFRSPNTGSPICAVRSRWSVRTWCYSMTRSPQMSLTGQRRLTGNGWSARLRSEEHTSELQSPDHLVCSLLLEKKNPPACRAMSGRRGGVNMSQTRYEGLHDLTALKYKPGAPFKHWKKPPALFFF